MEVKIVLTVRHTFSVTALMGDDIRLEEVTSKPRFDNANSKFYHKLIPKVAKIKRISTHVKTTRRQRKLRKCRHNEVCTLVNF